MKQKNIIEKLTQNGYRITTARKKIIAKVIQQKKLFCVQDISSKITGVDQTSVYRTFETLEKLKIIIPTIKIDGQEYYEKQDDTHHHHHIICTKCKKTKCVDCKTSIPTIKGFNNINHSLVLTGVCNTCT